MNHSARVVLFLGLLLLLPCSCWCLGVQVGGAGGWGPPHCQQLSRLLRHLPRSPRDQALDRGASLLGVSLLQLHSLQAHLHHAVAAYFRVIDRRLSNQLAMSWPQFHISNPLLASTGLSLGQQLCIARRLLKEAASDWSRAESTIPEMRRLNVTSRLLGMPSCFLQLAQQAVAMTTQDEACQETRLFDPLPALDANNYVDLAYHRVRKTLGFLQDGNTPLLTALPTCPLTSMAACSCQENQAAAE